MAKRKGKRKGKGKGKINKKSRKKSKNLENRLSEAPRHIELVNEIYNRVKYPSIIKNERYTFKNRYFHISDNFEGEIDAFCVMYRPAIKGRHAYVFEVKSSDSPKNREKAYKQLEKAIKYVRRTLNVKKVDAFYVYGKKNGAYEIKKYKTERFTPFY